MLRKNYRIITFFQIVIDLLLTVSALYSAYQIRFHSQLFTRFLPVEYGVPPLHDFINLKFILAICVIWPMVFKFNRMYRTKRGVPLIDVILSVISSVTLSTTFFLVITFFTRPIREGLAVPYSRAVLVTFWLLDILYILILRLGSRIVSRTLRRKGFNQRHILIAGAGELGKLFLRRVKRHPEMGLNIIGFVDDDKEKQWETIDGVSVLGTLDDVPRLIREKNIEQVYTALPLSAHRRIYHLLSQIQNECVDILIIPDILDYITFRAGFQNMDGIPVINLTETPLSGHNLVFKRLFDILVASVGLILLSPLMAAIALLVKFSSPGPVLYRQKRMGMDLKPFEILKFRSMYVNNDGEKGTGWTVENDPRITKVGKILRRFNLDELPQLINVLRGEMSLVGPRPEQPAFVEEFREKYPRYMVRHKVKSGITGWAQVNGYRGDTSIKKRLEYDMYYIENWSMFLDIKILFRTLLRTYTNFSRNDFPSL